MQAMQAELASLTSFGVYEVVGAEDRARTVASRKPGCALKISNIVVVEDGSRGPGH